MKTPFVSHRRVVVAGVLAVSTTLFVGCKDKAMEARADSLAVALAAMNAERDSLAGLVQSSSSDKDRALQQVIDATKFADQVDAELRQVRGLTSRVGVTKNDESGKTQAADAQRDILDRLTQMRQRLAARQAQVRSLLDTLKTLRADSSAAATLLADLNARLASRERDILAFQEEVSKLRAENTQLATEKAVLTDTVKAMDVRENKVYYVVGTKKQLVTDGLVTEEGGSRGLLIVKLGKTLVPARALDQTKFTMADRRQTLTIPLPRADRPYRIVSRHDVALIEASKKEKDGSFRGDAIRITDPAAFWSSSPYLIIAEK
jgi:hypothetical protein